MLWKNKVKEAGHRQYNRVHVHCTLDKQGYRHKIRICNREKWAKLRHWPVPHHQLV